MKIEDRVIDAILSAMDKRYDKALALICPAIEASARKKFRQDRITRENYKTFIRDYVGLIERFACCGINLSETRFPLTIETDRDPIEKPDIADIVYHAFRCTTAHGIEISDNFSFTERNDEGQVNWIINLENGKIAIPASIVWALIAIVVFCEANRDVTTVSGLYLTWGSNFERPGGSTYRFDLDVFWGAEGVVRTFFGKNDSVSVKMVF